MYEILVWTLGETEIPLYGPLMAAAFCLCLALGCLLGKRQGVKTSAMALYGLLAAGLGLLLGRGIYSAVNWYDVFMDEMGEFAGVLPFFDPSRGSVNVIGLLWGALTAATVAARLTKTTAAELLDAAVLPCLGMYVLARVMEPLSGQGYGDLMGMEVPVCWVEAGLTALLMACIPFLRKASRRPGTLCQYALTAWCLLQILPESLRCDNTLYILIFARVTHLGLAVTVGVILIRLLVQGAKRGLAVREIVLDAAGLAVGIGVCIATIFALDKTNLPKLLVYAVMLLSLMELGAVIGRRIHKEDVRA